MRNNAEEKNVSLIDEVDCAKLEEMDDDSLRELAAKLLMALPDKQRRSILFG